MLIRLFLSHCRDNPKYQEGFILVEAFRRDNRKGGFPVDCGSGGLLIFSIQIEQHALGE
jgi:hypothetical protein